MSSYNEPRSPRSARDIKRIAELEAENKLIKDEAKMFGKAFKKIEEENKKLQEEKDLASSAYTKTLKRRNWDASERKKLQEENKKLEEENKKLQEEKDLASSAYTKTLKRRNWDASERKKLQEENKKLKECVKRAQGDTSIFTATLYETKLKKEIIQLKEDLLKLAFNEESDSDEEEELSKYEEEGSDWAKGYGFSVKDGEYREVMAAGGDHFEDYVIKKDGCFIHNGCGYSAVAQFISCPKCLYVKVVHIGETYELEEGETDMYLMITECYQKEIMEYCDDEEEEEKIEINVVGVGFCQYENEEERDKQVVYCKNDCWKMKGDKTAKDEEGNYCETDEEQPDI
tara:strand:+ start:1820 stop:2851 length:1032 start_codon:yes stop_codon:yes gene_type:complete